jgi:hypothetical protein
MQIEKLRSLIREAVGDHIKEIEAVAEAAAMEARLAEYDKAIKMCEEKIATAENLEEVKDLMDTGKINELKKKLKDLKNKKGKLEKQKAKKNKGKEVTTDAETDKEETVDETANTMDETYVDETYTMDEMKLSDDEEAKLKADAEKNDKEYNIMNESFLKMQKLAGIITETQYNQKKNPLTEGFDRIEGLANIQDLATLKAKLRILSTDWMQDGFEKEDIKMYINNLIDQI